MMTGCVFDIKGFSTNDGPGPRTTVFLKGCPLRCVWCHNPEGLSPQPQLMVKTARCKHCGACMKPCHHAECQPYGRCLYACPDNLVSVSGTTMTSAELAQEVNKDREFLLSCDGGVTFSGGEPLMQADFLLETLDALDGMSAAIETSGYADEAVFRRVIDRMDYVMMDVKLADAARHRQYTGVDNARIVCNLRYLQASGKPHLLRTPLIPGITDTPENLRGVAELAGESPVELLPFNAMAGAKYGMMGMTFSYQPQPANAVDLSVFHHARLA